MSNSNSDKMAQAEWNRLDKMAVPQIKKLLKAKKLSLTGRKKELIDRYVESCGEQALFLREKESL